jgi:mycothiol system anti-sigma-R factor
MSPCDGFSLKILTYLDDRLQGQDLDDFRTHLESCSNCRAKVAAEQSLSQLLRRSRPLYTAPPALRARVAAAAEQHTAPASAREPFHERVTRLLGSGFANPARRVLGLRLLAASLAVVAILIVFAPNFVRHVRAANYVETAVATHRSYVDGSLPLELHTNSPEQVTAWFSGKVPFPFRLPKAQVTLGSRPTYELTGASLVKYRGKPAALVTYQKQNEKISLMVASADSAIVAGGEEVRSGELIFHFRTDHGFNVVTWTRHGLSYALVSSVAGPARASCMVCHQSMTDHQSFRSAQ